MIKFILANQNQPDKTTDIVIDTNKTICPEFDLPKLTSDYSHVLSIDETETYLSFIVSPELSKEYKKLTRNQSRSEDWKKLRKFRLTSSKSFKQIVLRKNDFEKLAATLLNQKCVQTAAMVYGLQHENEATKAYVNATGNNVYLIGIIINSSAPYLACSPG